MYSFSENELVGLILGVGALSFLLLQRTQLLNSIPFAKLLLYSFIAQFVGWFCTVAESFAYPEIYNFIEHLARFTSLALLLRWFILLNRLRSENQ